MDNSESTYPKIWKPIMDMLGIPNPDHVWVWIDWKHGLDEYIHDIEDRFRTGHLFAHWEDEPSSTHKHLHILYRDTKTLVPLKHDKSDLHMTIATLNDVLAPDFEVRYCMHSWGSDGAGMLPLSTKQWNELERQYPKHVEDCFYQIRPSPDIFNTHALIDKIRSTGR